jgi:hypothetical protein
LPEVVPEIFAPPEQAAAVRATTSAQSTAGEMHDLRLIAPVFNEEGDMG